MQDDIACLSGLLVVAVEQAVAAPLCTARLADAGARVIKIERGGGDFARSYDQAAKGDSSYFAWTNHGKESIELDIKQADDSALLHRMLATADVFVQNLAPGAMSRAGFDSEELRKRHPSLITCDISGYGNTDEVSALKAYDLLVQAESGLIAVSGGRGEPGRIGVSLCDIGAGLNAYTGILEALLRRGVSGTGGGVAVSLFDSAAEWMTVPLVHAETGTGAPARVGLRHPSIAPYGAFETSEGSLTLISIQNEREWVRLCTDVLKHSAMATDPRFTSNDHRVAERTALDAAITSLTSNMTADEFQTALGDASLAFGALNSVVELGNHAALRRRGVINSGGLALSLPAHPVSHSGHSDTDSNYPRVPACGEHTAAIRQEFACTISPANCQP